MEIWKPVVNYEGYYEVSNMGRVRRVDRRVNTEIRHNETKLWPGRILKQNRKRNGYYTVDLCKDNHVKTISVHRLVATAFVPACEGRTHVNHINCNKADNRAENLEWCTLQENIAHGKEHGLYVNHRKIPVRCKQNGMIFGSSYEAAEWLNETKFKGTKQVKNMASKIRSACLGMQSTAYGYTWEKV